MTEEEYRKINEQIESDMKDEDSDDGSQDS